MVTRGKPAFLPFTTPAAQAAAAEVCKPLYGNAFQSVGTTFAKAIAAAGPACCFAALSLETGFVLATGDWSVKNKALEFIAADAHATTAWYGPNFEPGARVPCWQLNDVIRDGESLMPNGYFTSQALALHPLLTYREAHSLAQQVNRWAEREGWHKVPAGFVLWFPGTSPALVMYDALGLDPMTNTISKTVSAFALWLVAAGAESGNEEFTPEPGLTTPVARTVCIAADKATFKAKLVEATDNVAGAPGWTASYWPPTAGITRRYWILPWIAAPTMPAAQFETGAIPSWFGLSLAAPLPPRAQLHYWTEPTSDTASTIMTTWGANSTEETETLVIDNA